MADTNPIPSDEFSQLFRKALDHPQTIRSSSTVNLIDFYGNTETWVVDTMRSEGIERVFLQRSNAKGGERLVLPPEVVDAIARQRERAIKVVRRRASHKGAATRKAKAAGK